MGTLILIAGRHPALRDGGSATYVRAWGRAAIRAGYTPHVFCADAETRTETTPYGVVHSAATPARPFRTIRLAAHGRHIQGAIDDFATDHGAPFLIHSFGSWGGVGLEAARRLSRRGLACITAITPFTTAMHEGRAKLRGAASAYGFGTAMHFYVELLWSALRMLIEDRALRGRVARGAHAQFQARFSAKAFVADVARAYRQLGFAPSPAEVPIPGF
jgi:hypothetical protein